MMGSLNMHCNMVHYESIKCVVKCVPFLYQTSQTSETTNSSVKCVDRTSSIEVAKSIELNQVAFAFSLLFQVRFVVASLGLQRSCITQRKYAWKHKSRVVIATKLLSNFTLMTIQLCGSIKSEFGLYHQQYTEASYSQICKCPLALIHS